MIQDDEILVPIKKKDFEIILDGLRRALVHWRKREGPDPDYVEERVDRLERLITYLEEDFDYQDPPEDKG